MATMKNISRRAACMISATNDPVLESAIYSLDTGEINSALKNENKLLKAALKAPVLPELNVEHFTTFKEEDMVKGADICDLRFVIHDSRKHPSGQDLSRINSHIVEISTSGECATSFDFLFISKDDSFKSLIVDVMLDVQMFHFYGLGSIYKTVEDKRCFSALKVAFCKDKKADYRFTSPHDFNHYCSFAFFCRESDNNLNFKKYLEMWQSFVAKLPGEGGHKLKDQTAKSIIAEHPHGKQLSLRKVRRMLDGCRLGGEYILVRIYKKPRKEVLKKRLQVLFGGEKLKVGAVKIVSIEQKYKYLKHRNNVEIFKFTVKDMS